MSETHARPHDADRRTVAQARAFDLIGERYDEAFEHKEGQVAAVSWLLDRLAPGARVLDVGCGTGLPTARGLVDGGCRVTGVDISPVMLGLARRNVPEADFEQADMRDAEIDPGLFDAATAFFSLLMLRRADLPAALRVLHSAVAPDGYLILGMVEADLDDTPIDFLGNEIRVTGYPLAQLRELVRPAGFTIEHETRREYAPVTPRTPPETHQFLHCRRDRT